MIKLADVTHRNSVKATVVGISWERIHLYLDVKVEFAADASKDVPLDFYAVNGKFAAKVHFDTQKVSDDIYRLHTNITNPGYNRCLQKGSYTICVVQGTNEVARCMTSEDIVDTLQDKSRAFLYGNRARSYSVVFSVDDERDDCLLFNMCTVADKKIDKWPLNPISRHYSDERDVKMTDPIFKDPAEALKIALKTDKFIRVFYQIMSKILPKPKDTILFMSEQNDKITPNQKAVYERMKERGLDKKYKLLFSFRAATQGNHMSIKNWADVIFKLLRSSMVILDDHAPIFDWLILRDHTKIVQLWHAGAGFKSSGYSRWGNKGCPAPYSCHRQYSYGIAGSRKIAHFFSEVWGINTEQVLPTGMPRMDEYLNEDYKKAKVEELYKAYPLCKGKKVILFAPTYRGKNKFFAYYPYNLIDFKKLYEICSDEYVVLFKMHPWVAEPVPIEEKYKDKFADVNTYPNINDLFYITDLLITDYSSNIFEYSLQRNPMLFFAFDEIQYSFSRGFHRPYKESAPGKVVHTFEELLKAIENKDFESYKVEEYVEHHFDYIDCGASDRVIDWIIEGNIPTDLKEGIDAKFEDVKHMTSLEFERVREDDRVNRAGIKERLINSLKKYYSKIRLRIVNSQTMINKAIAQDEQTVANLKSELAKKDFKVGVISINAHTLVLNLASPLHTYVFQQFLNEAGIDNVIIDYKPCYYKEDYDPKYPYDSLVAKKQRGEKVEEGELARWKELREERAVRFDKIQSFIDEKYVRTDKCYNYKTLDEEDPNCDIYIACTDIIWKYHGKKDKYDRGFFLNCKCMENKPKIVYAASVGAKTDYKSKARNLFEQLIAPIDYISTREKRLFEHINKNTDKQASLVIDPVFFFGADFYKKMAVKPKTQKKYVLLYAVMQKNTDLVKAALDFADKHGYEVIELSEYISEHGNIGSKPHKFVYDIGIEEWLGYIENAEYIFTNSFHQCVLSMIYGKQFFAGERDGDKLPWLLKIFGLSERKVDCVEQCEALNDIDYTRINKLIHKYSIRSKKFILQAIYNSANGSKRDIPSGIEYYL